MKTIWKFALPEGLNGEIETPEDFGPLTVQLQHGEPYIWALVDTDSPTVRRRVVTYGTGQPCMFSESVDSMYAGSFQLEGGALVFHVFVESND